MKYIVTKDCVLEGKLRYGHLKVEIDANSKEEVKEKIEKLNWFEKGKLIIDDYDLEEYEISNYEPEIILKEE